MKILLAIDSFKGSATSKELNEAVAQGIKKLAPETEIFSYPVADGGEGTLAAFWENGQGQLQQMDGYDLFGKAITVNFLLQKKQTVAVLEVAETSGIQFLKADSPIQQASSYSLGQLIKKISLTFPTVKEFIIGLGGSGINDAGSGMMQALGVSFKDASGKEIALGTSELKNIVTIDDSQLLAEIKEKKFTLLSDVKNPLLGEQGATYIFGPQKGLKNLAQVDQSLAHYADVLTKKYQRDYRELAGAGAAGGVGFSLLYFAETVYQAGGEYILTAIGMREVLPEVDLVITGEGKMDRQSAFGKLPSIVAGYAKENQKKVIALVGDSSQVTSENYQVGIDLILNLSRGPIALAEAMAQTKNLASQRGEDIVRIMAL